VSAGEVQVSLAVEDAEGGTLFVRSRLVQVEGAGAFEVDLKPLGSAIVAGTVQSAVALQDELNVTLIPRSEQPLDPSEQLRRTLATHARGGVFELDGVEAGAYRVSVNARVGGVWYSGQAGVDVADEGRVDVVIELRER